MNTQIQNQGFTLSPAIESRVKTRLDRALSRFEPDIIGVNVYLSDVNGPRGGADKRVVMRVGLPGLPPVSIMTQHEDLYVAIDRSARRLGRAVKRALSRSRRLTPRKVLRLRRMALETATG